MILKSEKDFISINPDFHVLNFSEMACKDCCQSMYYDEKVSDFLDKLSAFSLSELKYPIRVTNLFRCEKKNKKVNGSPSSAHLSSLACDIWVPGVSLESIFRKAWYSGLFSGVGIYDTMVHVDVKKRKKKICWATSFRGVPKYFESPEEAIEYRKKSMGMK